MALLNVPRIVITILTFYNWYYNSNSLARHMVADSYHRQKTFRIDKKVLESRKIFQCQKKIMKSRKKNLKSRKIFRNWENNFRIEKNISESRKTFQNWEKRFKIEKNVSKSKKMFQNWKNYFKIEKNVSEQRNILLQESRKNLEFNEFKFNEPPR